MNKHTKRVIEDYAMSTTAVVSRIEWVLGVVNKLPPPKSFTYSLDGWSYFKAENLQQT